MTTETIIFQSVARRLEAGTYLYPTKCRAPIPAQPSPAVSVIRWVLSREYLPGLIGSSLLGGIIGWMLGCGL